MIKSNHIILFIILLNLCCNKDEFNFPDTNVNFFIYPNNPSSEGLHFPGGTLNIEGGLNGIIIFHDYLDNYIAYDRACTNNPLLSCEQVDLDAENINILKCNCCPSNYLIFDGSVVNGPAQNSLKRYNTSFDGIVLRIFN